MGMNGRKKQAKPKNAQMSWFFNIRGCGYMLERIFVFEYLCTKSSTTSIKKTSSRFIIYMSNKVINSYSRVYSHHKVHVLVEENPYLLLMLQHFTMDFTVGDATVEQLCKKYNFPENLFLLIANLYNGHKMDYAPKHDTVREDLKQLLLFLANSHTYYRNESYPLINSYILQLQKDNPHKKEIKVLETFFETYFQEVIEHLDYEDKTAFPYFRSFIFNGNQGGKTPYRSTDYLKHHTDIELKLNDLKNLLLKHIPLENQFPLRRKLFFALFELEFDLKIHSIIEEHILIPAFATLENS